MNEILQVQDVVKYYGSANVVTKALDGVSFQVERGEFTAIMGASGSGKTTLLNVISTIDRMSGGSIVLDGKSLSQMNENQLSDFRRDHLGFIFQDYNLLDTLTVEENITLPLNLRKIGEKEIKKQLDKVVHTLGIEKELHKFPRELSGGQKQRTACARALIASPSLILADEPTGALDSANSRILMETLLMMNQSLGCTILMVTHDPVVGSYARRILFLKDGKIWSEANRGDRDRHAMYNEILTVMAALGGEGYVH